MAIVSNALPGTLGLIVDQEPAEIPPGAWSDALNVRFTNGAAKSMLGDKEIVVSLDQPEWAFPVAASSDTLASWVVCSSDKAYALAWDELVDITPTGVTGIPGNGLVWTGGAIGSAVFVNNGMQVPWAWLDVDPEDPMVTLPNWPSTLRAAVLRSFKNYLIALNITKSSTRYPSMVKWSHPADAGSVPISWDETDPTRDAGEYPLSETPGECVDLVPLKDVAVIYKSDSVWGMQWIGGVYIFRFFKMFSDFGMPKKDCAVEFAAGKHFVFTGTDAIVHDGVSARSVATGKVKSLFRTISTDQLSTSYVLSHTAMNEVWFCWRRSADGKMAADTALVFNHLDETWALRELNDYRFIGAGPVNAQNSTASVWGGYTGTWGEASLTWGEFTSIPAYKRLLAMSEQGLTWVDGLTIPLEGKLERTYVGIPVRTNQPPDLTCRKFVTIVWPRFKGEAGQRLLLTFGAAEGVAEEVKWKPTKTFTIGESRKACLTLSGRLIALRIETDPTSEVQGIWSYHGLDMEVQKLGDE